MRVRMICLAAVGAALLATASAAADPGPALSIDASSGHHAISPLIYGWNTPVNGMSTADATQIDLPVDRRGGNAADTLNWQTGVENHSNDYFFENLPTCFGESGCDNTWDPARSYTDQIGFDRTVGAETIIDLPMLGLVPAGAAVFDHPVPCSFHVDVLGAQYQNDSQFDPNCGDGRKPDNSDWITNTVDPAGTGQAEPASFQGSWIDDLVGRYQNAASGGVAFYELGNEPGLWNSTHHDWHPSPVDANELLTKSENLAIQVKQHDSTAQTIGPAEWGWPNYFCSPKDGGCGPGGPDPVAGTDFETYGPMMEAYLKHFADYQQNNGTRLLDYLDLHYYAQGGSTPDITRSLWDPTYNDPSWIDYPIQLIPRMRQWVADDYPGTKISLSEYDLANGGNTTTNNIIEADVLGIFAREQMDMATLWPEVSNDNYFDAFRIYRNYDGSHSKFGDTYVSSTSANQAQLSVYGAKRSGDGALTVIAINKTGSELTSALSVAGFTPGPQAQVWRWQGVGGGIVRQADQPVCNSGFTATFPANSVTMLVFPAGNGTCGTAAGGGTTGGTGGTTGGTGGPTGSTPPPPTGSGSGVRCVVPKLLGLTIKKAKKKLAKAHCRLGKVAKKKSGKKRGTVIAQRPKPRAKLARGAKVAVTLSRGP